MDPKQAMLLEPICLPLRYWESMQIDLAALSSWSLSWKKRVQKRDGGKKKSRDAD